MQKLEAFMVWLSANEATEEQKNEIVESLDFEDFTVEELLTSVRDSGLYTAKKIDERVINLFKIQDKQIHEKCKRSARYVIENKDYWLEQKDLKIKEQELKINELKDALRDAQKYIP